MKILIVEDEVKITQALNFLFNKQKIDVDIANDGEEGLILASKDIYDVIVLDIMLPEVDGIQILKTIRKSGIKTPVIMLTANDAGLCGVSLTNILPNGCTQKETGRGPKPKGRSARCDGLCPAF